MFRRPSARPQATRRLHPQTSNPFHLEGLEIRRLLTVPPTPIHQSETGKTQTTITLSWPGSSTAEDGFQVQRQIGANYVAIANTPNNFTTFTDTGLTPATSYNYRIIAYRGQSISGFAYVNGAVTSGVGASAEMPYNGSAVAVPGTIQAENFDLGGEGVGFHSGNTQNFTNNLYRAGTVSIENTSDAGGGYDVGYLRAGDYLKYTINVATAGNYDLAARVSNNANGGAFHIEVDNSNLTGSEAIPNTGSFQTYQNVTKQAVPLTAGTHVVKIVFDTNSSVNGYAGNLNYIQVTPTAVGVTGNTPFTGTPATLPGRVEAENFDNGGEGYAYHTANPQNLSSNLYRTSGISVEATKDTGGGYHVGFLHAGDYLNYTVNVTTAGTYTFDARVSNISPGGTFHAEVDGVNLTGELAVPNTGDFFSKFADVTAVGVPLTAGKHVIKIAFDANAIQGFAGNLNWFQFT